MLLFFHPMTKELNGYLFSTDASAADPRIDALRAKIYCVEEKRFSVEYHDPSKRSIGNALLVELNDGTILDEVEIEYPVGHKRRRAEGTPLLINKFKRCVIPSQLY
jgi:2-methylcitrate dehydratase